jgi:RND family efflux transporter MFP subunit
VDERRSALEKTFVRAPVSGRVGGRNAEIGMLVDSDTVLFRIGNLERVIVEVPLTEGMLARVREGDPVLVASRGQGGEALEARLTRISPFLRDESFTSEGEIDIDNSAGQLRPGMFVSVDILFGRSDEATLLPTSAVWEDPRTGERGVFVVEGGPTLTTPAAPTRDNPDQAHAVRFRPVEVLASGRGRMGVRGVEANEWVVIAGQHLLRRRMQDAAAGSEQDLTEARIRPTTWKRVTSLQDLQREDLLAGFLEKQRRVARALGAEIPESESVVQKLLEEETAEVAGAR